MTGAKDSQTGGLAAKQRQKVERLRKQLQKEESKLNNVNDRKTIAKNAKQRVDSTSDVTVNAGRTPITLKSEGGESARAAKVAEELATSVERSSLSQTARREESRISPALAESDVSHSEGSGTNSSSDTSTDDFTSSSGSSSSDESSDEEVPEIATSKAINHLKQASSARNKSRGVCIQFKKTGKCRYGSKCHFTHDISSSKTGSGSTVQVRRRKSLYERVRV